MYYADLILGTTASGKSAYAIKHASDRGGIVLSIDSVSIYRQLNIGTAKPAKFILDEIPHYGVNIANIDEFYSAIDFKKEALKVIAFAKAEEIPLFITVGSFFYLKVLLTEQNNLPPINSENERILLQRIDCEGLLALYRELEVKDPKSALKIHSNDKYRIVRALSFYYETGKVFSSFNNVESNNPEKPEWINKVTILSSNKEELEKSIQNRTTAMLKNGLVEEVRDLLKSGYQKNLRALQCVGYKEVISFLSNEISEAELPMLINRSTLQLAKRQRTWIRNGFNRVLFPT